MNGRKSGTGWANVRALAASAVLALGASSCLVTSVSVEDESAIDTYQLTGGAGGLGGNLSSVSNCAQNAFRQGLHNVLLSACSSCHSDEFASSNPSVAYSNAKARSNFSNPGNSTLAVYAGNGSHGCGGNCNAGTKTAVTNAMTTWGKAEEGDAATCAEYATAPDSGGNVTVKPFDLGAYTPPNPNNTVVVAEGLAEFSSAGSVHAMVLNNCAQCHIPGGIARLAPFAVSDATASYREAKPRSNLSAIESSLMLQKASTAGHGPGCTVCGNTTFVNNLKAEMTAWAQKENAAIQAAHVRLSNIPVYINGANVSLMNSNYVASVKLSWNLGQAGVTTPSRSGALSGATFEVTLNMLNSSTFRFTNPVLKTGGKSVRVKKLTFIVNDVYRTEATSYQSIDLLVGANNTAGQALATFPALMSAPADVSPDVAVDFELLE